MLLQPDVHVNAVDPQVEVVHGGQVPAPNVRCSACQASVSRVITAADSPAEEPGNWPSTGTKSPLDGPVTGKVHPSRPIHRSQALLRLMLRWSSMVPIVVVNISPVTCHTAPAFSRSGACAATSASWCHRRPRPSSKPNRRGLHAVPVQLHRPRREA